MDCSLSSSAFAPFLETLNSAESVSNRSMAALSSFLASGAAMLASVLARDPPPEERSILSTDVARRSRKSFFLRATPSLT